MAQEYCKNTNLAYVRWTNPKTEELEQFRSDYPPVSYSLEEIIEPPEFYGGKCPNTNYYLRYQGAIIRNGDFAYWTDPPVKKGLAHVDFPVSNLKLTANNIEINYREDGFLFHWSFDRKGLYPFGRNKTYVVRVDTPTESNKVILVTNSMGIKLLRFEPVNGQINCEEDRDEGSTKCEFKIFDTRGQVFAREFPDSSCPQVGVICDKERCPDNTCAVDCGDHICCYDNRGIAVKSIAK